VSTPNTAAAGWYPDPNDGRQQRWWDGSQWTEHVSGPQAPAQPSTVTTLSAPAGTDWRTPWIWLVLFLPLLPIIPLLLIDWSSLVTIDPVTLEADPTAQLAVFTSPAYWISVLGGWICYGLAVVFAYLDWKELGRRGVPSPFHWAWTFLSSYVYGIGRGVVVQRRTGGGIVVMWVAIGVLALSIVLGIVISIVVFAAVIAQVPFS
jgi:Protein of unknown function (DUF2510)